MITSLWNNGKCYVLFINEKKIRLTSGNTLVIGIKEKTLGWGYTVVGRLCGLMGKKILIDLMEKWNHGIVITCKISILIADKKLKIVK